MLETQCQPVTLIKTSTCDTWYCSDCEVVHLTLGTLTLRITREYFQQLTIDLIQAEMQLSHISLSGDARTTDNVTTIWS